MIKWFMGLNRHLRVAIILAPFLGIFGFGLADTWVTKGQPERSQQSVAVRELALTGQCLLTVNCQLSNGEMAVVLQSATASATDLLRVNITATGHVRGLKIALVQGGQEDKLAAQATTKTDQWYVEFPRSLLQQNTFVMRLALAQTKRVYLAEFPAWFQ